MIVYHYLKITPQIKVRRSWRPHFLVQEFARHLVLESLLDTFCCIGRGILLLEEVFFVIGLLVSARKNYGPSTNNFIDLRYLKKSKVQK